MLLDINNLDAGYGKRTVLHGVNLQFAGGIAGLLGPNGAGKSTLLKTILGFLTPLAGQVEALGYELPRQAAEVRARVGYMPEQESFLPGLTGVQFVAYMAQLSGLPRAAAMERAHEVLQYVGLGESRYRKLEEYSLGMKQRAKLAQAIVHDPALLLLDEPTNGLDPAGRLEMLDLVNDLAARKGIAVILCSHLLKDVESVADEIIMLGAGRVTSRRLASRDAELAPAAAYCVRLRGDVHAFAKALALHGLRVLNAETLGHELLVTAADKPVFKPGSQKAEAPPPLPASAHPPEPGQVAADGDEPSTLPLPLAIYRAARESGCLVQRLEPRTERLEDLYRQASQELNHAHL